MTSSPNAAGVNVPRLTTAFTLHVNVKNCCWHKQKLFSPGVTELMKQRVNKKWSKWQWVIYVYSVVINLSIYISIINHSACLSRDKRNQLKTVWIYCLWTICNSYIKIFTLFICLNVICYCYLITNIYFLTVECCFISRSSCCWIGCCSSFCSCCWICCNLCCCCWLSSCSPMA